MLALNDHGMVDAGLSAPQALAGVFPGRVLVIACGALAREILALRKLNQWDHLELTCLPAKLHLHPELIPDAVARAIEDARPQYDRIFVAYADCGTGGLLAARCRELGVEMVAGPHCYSFFDGNAAFAARADAEMRAFFLTDFLVRQFDAFVWKPMGLDRHPELREMLFGHYERVIYLAQTQDARLDTEAARCARRLGLAYERRTTGYGDLATALATLSPEAVA